MSLVERNLNNKGYENAIISEKVKSHATDPFFVKKLERAKRTLSKIILPENRKK